MGFLKTTFPGSHKIVFKGGVQKEKQKQQQQLQTNTIAGVNTNTVSGSNGSFAFPSGWNFETTYDLTVNIDATYGYSHSSSSNQSLIIEQLNRITTTAAQHNVVKLLADMVRNRLHDAVNLLEITSKDRVIRNVSFANFITKKYMGIPADIDV